MIMEPWTDERIELLIQYAAKLDPVMTASDIAHKLGGTTRNAVIGKINRLGLALKGSNSKLRTFNPLPRRVPRRRPARVKTSPITNVPYHHCPADVPRPLPIPKADDVARVSFADLEPHHCRFIPFEPTDGFCGLPKVEGASYCAGHLARCTTEWESRTIHSHDRIGGSQTIEATVAELLVPA